MSLQPLGPKGGGSHGSTPFQDPITPFEVFQVESKTGKIGGLLLIMPSSIDRTDQMCPVHIVKEPINPVSHSDHGHLFA